MDEAPEFYYPKTWRARPEGSVKQGSGEGLSVFQSNRAEANVEWVGSVAHQVYRSLLADGVAPEMARMVLPQNTYTELWMTASLSAVARIVGLRADPHAQWEIQQYAHAISQLVEPLFPHSWKALTNG